MVISITDSYAQQLCGTYRSSRNDEIEFNKGSFKFRLYYSTLGTRQFGAGHVYSISKARYQLDLDSLYKTNKLTYEIISQRKCDSTIINIDLLIYSDSLNCSGINWGLRNFEKHKYHSEFESICNISVNISNFDYKANIIYVSAPGFTDLDINIDKNTITNYKVFLDSEQLEISTEKMKIRLKKSGSKLILNGSKSVSDRRRVIFEKVEN
jgi:hypothetical protein